MHQDLGFKPSPLLEKVLQEKLPKLAPEALQAVIKRARNLTRLTQPSGCAQNLKAEFQDPEKALEYSKRKNQLFETYLKTEINKLHFKESLSMRPEPSVFSKSCQPSPTKLSVKPSKSLEISPSLRNPRKAKSFCSSLRNKPRNSLESFIEVALNKEQLVLPPLVKSVPIHLDPQFAFPKKDSAQEAEKIEKVKNLRMKSLNFVDLRCRNFRPECKSDAYEIALMQDLRRKQDEKFGVYVEDLADCLKLANDQASLEASLINKSHNRRLNEEFLSELAVLKEGLLDVTKDAIDYGGKKIWRYKNTLFLAKTDRVINSVPTTRK
jgi:hypothetical protein